MKLSISKILALVAISGMVALTSAGCKKNNSSKSTSGSTDSLPSAIRFSSVACAYYPNIPVNFYPYTTNIPAGTTFLWNFGDGDTSSEEFPVHTYTTSATYTVTLAFNAAASHTISRGIYISPVTGSHYTQLIGGMREWVGMATGYTGSIYGLDLDTTLAVQVVDSGIVKFLYDSAPMYISNIDTIGLNYITYTDCSGRRIMWYYYLRDSISYSYDGWTPNHVGESFPYIKIHTK